MAKFSAEVTDIQETASSTPITPVFQPLQNPVDTTAADNLSVLGDVLKTGVEFRKEGLKDDFLSDLKANDDDSSNFNKLRTKLMDEALNTKERSDFDNIISKLQSLDRGEISGVLSPTEAKAKKEILLKQAVIDHPWMAPEFKSLASVFNSRSQGKAKASPIEKANNELIEESVKQGTVPEVIRQHNALKRMKEDSDASLKMSLNSGKLAFPEIRVAAQLSAQVQVQDIWAKLRVRVKNDPTSIDSTDFKPTLEQIRIDTANALHKSIAELQRKGITLSGDEVKVLEKDISDAFSPLSSFVDSKDRLGSITRYNKLTKELGTKTLTEISPWAAMLTAQGMGEQAASYQFKIVPKMQRILNKYGMEEIELKAGAGDIESLQYLQGLKFNKGFALNMAHAGVMNNRPGTSNAERVVVNTYAGSVLGIDNVDDNPKMNEVQDRAVDRLTDPTNNDRELDWFLQPDVVPNIARDSERKKKISNRVDQSVSNAIIRSVGEIKTPVDGEMKEMLVFDSINDMFMVWGVKEGVPTRPTFGADPTNQTDKATEAQIQRRISRHSFELQGVLRSFNTAYKIKKMYGMWDTNGGMNKWTSDVISHQTQLMNKSEEIKEDKEDKIEIVDGVDTVVGKQKKGADK